VMVRDRIKEFRRVPARDLRPNPLNWRKHPQAQRDALRGILTEVGYADALIARQTEDGVLELIDGHLRAETTPDMEVPVLVLDVTKEEADKLLASLDPIATMAEKDEDAIRAILAGVKIDNEALASLFEGLVEPELEEGLTDPDVVPEPPAVTVTKPGDLYHLGAHRLLCGDSSKAEDVDRLLDGAPIHLVNTDPPYNVKVEPRSNNALAHAMREKKVLGKNSKSDLVRHGKPTPTGPMRPRDRALVGDWIPDEEFNALLRKWFGNIARVLLPGRSYYIWAGYSNVFNYPDAILTSGLHFSQIIVWVKGHPVPTRRDFMGDHEHCYYGWKPGRAHYFNPAIHNATDVWSVKKVNPQSMIHLTERPVELALRAMEYSSRRGENVLDLFGGSGSTLIAAQQAGRRAFMMEIDPLYCDVIVARWETFTGQKAKRMT
jgi:DNA modification methylase